MTRQSLFRAPRAQLGRLLIVTATLLGSASALAQTVETIDSAVPGERQTRIIFGVDTIEGTPKGPAGETIHAPVAVKHHRSLIRLRTDFRREVLRSVAGL